MGMQFIEKEKHVEGLIEKLSVRLEQVADLAGGAASAAAEKEKAAKTASRAMVDGDDAEPTSTPSSTMRAAETVTCLATALGSMNYTDRCILRLHDAVVTRKALNNAISFHQITRKNLMDIVDKTRKQKVGGKEKTEAPAVEEEKKDAAVANADEGGKKGAAVVSALDGIEQLVKKLGAGQDAEKEVQEETKAVTIREVEEPTTAGLVAEDPSAGAVASAKAAEATSKPAKEGRGRGTKRNAEQQAQPVREDMQPEEGMETLAEVADVAAGRTGAGRARGRTRKDEKENQPAVVRKEAKEAPHKPAKPSGNNLDRLFGGGNESKRPRKAMGSV